MSDHNHEHDHNHGTFHCHSHEDKPAQNVNETVALLNYMIDHNKHHGEDLHEIYHALDATGKKEAAEFVHEAIHLYNDGNEKLAEALKLIGG